MGTLRANHQDDTGPHLGAELLIEVADDLAIRLVVRDDVVLLAQRLVVVDFAVGQGRYT